MPFGRFRSRRRYRPRYGRRRYRPRYGLATRPRFMSRGLRMRRQNQNSTRVFYFRENGIISSATIPSIYNRWITQDSYPPTSPILTLQTCSKLYDQYKLLSMSVKLFPANVGDESLGQVSFAVVRGNCAVWSDQRFDPSLQQPTLITQVINNASCRMIHPRRGYTKTIYRPRGYNKWGSCAVNIGETDEWRGSIELLQTETTTPAQPYQLWYWTRSYKVLFRSRVQV